MSVPVNSSKIELKGSGFFGFNYPTANAISSSTVMEDYIYAKSRIYNADSVLTGSKVDSETYSSFVSAQSTHNKTHEYGCFAYGNHIYKLKGYKDVIHETYGEW